MVHTKADVRVWRGRSNVSIAIQQSRHTLRNKENLINLTTGNSITTRYKEKAATSLKYVELCTAPFNLFFTIIIGNSLAGVQKGKIN